MLIVCLANSDLLARYFLSTAEPCSGLCQCIVFLGTPIARRFRRTTERDISPLQKATAFLLNIAHNFNRLCAVYSLLSIKFCFAVAKNLDF